MKDQLRHYKNIWTMRFTDKDGNVLFEESGPNNLTQLGQAWIMQAAFQKAFVNDKLFIRLANQTFSQDDTISSVTSEPTINVNGYAPREIERNNTVGFPNEPTVVDTYSVLISKSVQWTATGGNIGPINVAFLATSDGGITIPDSSGTLLAYKELPVTQTILSGNTGTIYMQITLA